MKSSKSLRQQYANERKTGKRSEKAAKLDRKSSRGMIYENEELRLRTININAEVERGQSDIKRLRRENEQLRREIWGLRDECDRLNKRFKAKILEQEHGGGCNARGSGGSGGRRGSAGHCTGNGNGAGCDGRHSNSQSEDSDSCDTCRCDDDQCSDDCCNDGSCSQSLALTKQHLQKQLYEEQQNLAAATRANTTTNNSSVGQQNANNDVPNLHKNFDHLSIVSEETLSTGEQQQQQQQQQIHQQNEHYLGYSGAAGELHSSQSTLPSLVGPLTPLTPIEQVANQLNDLQAVVPPLSYFENVLAKHMNSSGSSGMLGTSPESSTATTTTSGSSKTVRNTNGWDYNLQSPFTQRKYSTAAQPATAATPTLTTFVPTNSTPSNYNKTQDLPKCSSTSSADTLLCETVAITTMPTSTPPTVNGGNGSGSPKHFFAPLKPRLKLNTNLANKSLTPASVPTPPYPTTPNCEPPDLYVTNGLATPYQRQTPANAAVSRSPQTDSVNLETILNDIESISEDILAIQLEKSKSRENIAMSRRQQQQHHHQQQQQNQQRQQELAQGESKIKPYRSEMNLLLSYDGTNPTITPATLMATTQNNVNASHVSGGAGSGSGRRTRTRSLEREHTDSPSPHVPAPMQPFPDNRTYIGFDQLNKAAVGASKARMPPLPPPAAAGAAQMLTTLTPVGTTTTTLAAKPPPPLPPARLFPSTPGAGQNGAAANGLAPNKSNLYAAIAQAAAKRAQYRNISENLTRSLDNQMELSELQNALNSATNKATGRNGGETSAVAVSMPKIEVEGSEPPAIAAARQRKARRVSILCGETSAGTPQSHTPGTPLTPTQPLTAGSCSDLPTIMLQNPTIKYLKQGNNINNSSHHHHSHSHSTPNSPHSTRRHNDTPATPNTPPLNIPIPPTIQQQRKSSQDSIRTGINPEQQQQQTATVTRTKCSRRHSDTGSTIAQNTQRISGTSQQQHQHHHHSHSHSHSSAVFGTNPHHSHHSRRDSNHETATSLSDRNSNSFASSRESSTSFSMRSTRRKISISSHAGGKIPWCGCWGNGCL